LGVVDELCGNADEFEDDMDATAFDLNDASMEAKSLIFHLHRVWFTWHLFAMAMAMCTVCPSTVPRLVTVPFLFLTSTSTTTMTMHDVRDVSIDEWS
jgi:4-hydroxybenzoate polyprenyltransferase